MPPNDASLIAVHDLGCVRGDRALFSALRFAVAAGEVLHVTGANGSGKTSLLRILAGLSEPAGGKVHWRGEDIAAQPARLRRELLFLGHASGVKQELSAVENLRAAVSLQSVTPVALAGIEQALATVDLYGFENVPASALSAGQRRRVALARLLLSHATLWLLDEPFTSLDADGIGLISGLLQAHAARGGAIVLTSHQRPALDGVDVSDLRLGA